jgi:prepilin-type N-terminal cleavage/methylation domain-containing protein
MSDRKDRKIFRRTRRALGLTLLELLIVISLISILAGMIFVVGRAVRERAHKLAGDISNGTLHNHRHDNSRLSP